MVFVSNMEQQFSLSWNNFHGNLSKGFAGLLGNGEFVDVTIAVEGHLIQAHKVILSICSPYFKKMFQMNPCQHPIVVLRDVTHKAMKDLLQFMYHGEVSVKREDLTSFIGTAEVLQIKGLTNKEVDNDNVNQNEELPNCSMESQDKNLHNAESYVSDTVDNPFVENITQSDTNASKQRDLLERLHKLTNFKRKSEEFLQKTFYNTEISTEKRLKLSDRPVINKNLNTAPSNFESVCNVYDEMQKDISTNFVPHLKHSNQNANVNQDIFEKNHSCELSPDEVPIDLKTECEDNDILNEAAVSTHLKNYETAKERSDYSTVQERALSLVMNGSCEDQLPSRYKYIYSRKGHKQLVHMNFVYTKHSTSHGKTSWRCVQYFSLNRCPATVETIDSMIYTVNHQHNHEDCYEKLTKNNIYEMDVE